LFVTLHADAHPRALEATLRQQKAKECRLAFGGSVKSIADESRRRQEVLKCKMVDLTRHYRVRVAPERMHETAARLRELGDVAAAYVMPAVALPANLCKVLKPNPTAPAVTGDFISRQGYLGPAAVGGVDAQFAWTRSGGRGAGVNVVHIEGAWNFDHEDLDQHQGRRLLFGQQVKDPCTRQHGTAVLGVLGGDGGGTGVTGICPEALLRTAAVAWDENPDEMSWPEAMKKVVEKLNPGDIVLIEMQHPGPTTPDGAFIFNDARRGFIPPEWWPSGFDAIKDATTKGIIVVEAAGNGDVNLDDDALDKGDVGFPADWINPFRRKSAEHDSGSILVGAGSPPQKPHGPDVVLTAARLKRFGPERSRIEFSNFGSAVDVQAWGEEVTTCGYGSLQGGRKDLRWYTDQFAGTSSAAPIVAGVLACIQGIQKASGRPPLTPGQARQLLRDVGVDQTDGAGGKLPRTQRIGKRPDLSQLIQKLP
jgi:hypothetical protein